MSIVNGKSRALGYSSATFSAALVLCLGLTACGHDDTPAALIPAKYDTPEKLMLLPCDLDGDHIITRAEVEQVIAAQMESADTDHDGKISTTEASAWNMQQASRQDASEQTPLTDWTGDGLIDSDEFGAALRTAFDRLDTDHDGKVTTAELNQTLHSTEPRDGKKQDPADKQVEDGSGGAAGH